MKNLILLIIVAITVWACSKSNNNDSDGYPGPFGTAIIFEKNTGVSFEAGEIMYRSFIINDARDTTHRDTWLPLRKNTITSEEIPFQDFFLVERSFLEYNSNAYFDGRPWRLQTVFQFKYEGIETIDKLTIVDIGNLKPNTREVENLSQEYYFNDEPIEPILLVPLFDLYYEAVFKIQKNIE